MITVLFSICIIAFCVYYGLVYVEHFNNRTYKSYINIEKNIKKFFKNNIGSHSISPYASVPKNMEWKIHRWSIWDYDPSFKYPYYCNIKTYLDSEKCVPITNKKYCNVQNLYKTEDECLNKRHNV
jgi:hypothetical protein